jgi:hypothetical protein
VGLLDVLKQFIGDDTHSGIRLINPVATAAIAGQYEIVEVRTSRGVSVPDMAIATPSRAYEIAEVRTSRGVSRAMLFSKAIIQAERDANAALRESMVIKREQFAGTEGEARC